MATEFEELELKVSFVDDATPQLKTLLGEVQKLGVGEQANRAFKDLADSTNKFGQELNKVGAILSEITKVNFSGLLGAGGLAGFALAIKSINDQLGNFSREMIQLQNASRAAGVLPDQFKNITTQLEQMGYSASEAQDDLVSFFRTVDEASRAGSAQFQRIWRESWNPDVTLARIRSLRDMIARGEGGRALSEAAREAQAIFTRELNRPGGGGRAEATRQAEAWLQSIGLNLKALGIRDISDVIGDPDKWQRRIDAANAFNKEYVKFGQITGDVGTELKMTLLPAFEDMNKWLIQNKEAWVNLIPNTLRTDLRDIQKIIALITGDWTKFASLLEPGFLRNLITGNLPSDRERVPQGPPTAFGEPPKGPDYEKRKAMEELQRRREERRREFEQNRGIPAIGDLLKPQRLQGQQGGQLPDLSGIRVNEENWSKMINDPTLIAMGAARIERRDLLEKGNDEKRKLTDEFRLLADALEEQEFGEGGLGGLRAGTGAGRGWGYGGRGTGPSGGGRDGTTKDGSKPTGNTPTTTPAYQEPGTGTPGVGPNPPSIPGAGGIPALPGTPGGAPFGQPYTTDPRFYDPAGVAGLPGGPSGAAMYGPSRGGGTPGGAPPAGTSGTQGVGQSLVDYVAGVEKFNPKAFWDINQWNIGYGTSARGRTSITEGEARQEMVAQLNKHYNEISAQFPNAPEGVKQSLASLTYNAGDKWRTGPSVNEDGTPTLKGLLEKGDYNAARNKFQEYSKAGGQTLPGLAARRKAEVQQFWDNPKLQGVRAPGAAPTAGAPGALADQSNRPFKIGGKNMLTLGDQSFTYVTGGGGRGSTPYGTFPINLTKEYGGPGYSSIRAIATVGTNPAGGGSLQDPRYPGNPREGIQIHSTSGDTLENMRTAGCFGISSAQWPAFKEALLKLSRENPEGLFLTLDRNGRASITPRNAVSTVTRNFTPGGSAGPAAPLLATPSGSLTAQPGGTTWTSAAAGGGAASIPALSTTAAGRQPTAQESEDMLNRELIDLGKRGQKPDEAYRKYNEREAARKAAVAENVPLPTADPRGRSALDRTQRVRGRAGVDVTINKSENASSTPKAGPFKKIPMPRQRQNEFASSGAPEPTAANHDPGLDS
jgi:GH24 family phage-related lysozyme (muramidase)